MDEVKRYLVENLRDPVWYTETMWSKGLSGFPPAILTCAITGGNGGKELCAGLPESIPEQVESACEAYKAGAAMVHIHCRQPDNLAAMSWDPEPYIEVNAKIREKCPDLIINNTAVCGRMLDAEAQTMGGLNLKIPQAKAEVSSVDVSCYFSQIPMKPRLPEHPEPWFKNNGYCISKSDVDVALELLKSLNIKPEFECFAMTDLQYIRSLVNKGWQDPMGPNWISFVYTNGSNWNLPEFMSTLKMVVPNNSMLNIIATGTQQWPVLAMALIHGFNIRVGMEDGVYLEKGRKADSNAQLVEKAVGLAKMVGRPIATCEQARTMLGLGAPRQYTGK
jgi:3-keto-5-aminohexanoate cleavage enzyme